MSLSERTDYFVNPVCPIKNQFLVYTAFSFLWFKPRVSKLFWLGARLPNLKDPRATKIAEILTVEKAYANNTLFDFCTTGFKEHEKQSMSIIFKQLTWYIFSIRPLLDIILGARIIFATFFSQEFLLEACGQSEFSRPLANATVSTFNNNTFRCKELKVFRTTNVSMKVGPNNFKLFLFLGRRV